MKNIARIGLAATLIALGSQAVAAPKPFEAVEYRKGIFKAVKWNFGPMGDMLKGKQAFDAKEFSTRANNLAALSKMPLEGFIAGTYERSTSALPAIESDWETFAGLMADFETNTAALATAAAGGDQNAIRPAFMKVAQTCKSCHDKFKD